MSVTTPDLSTTYHERYQWCTTYLKSLTDLKANPERYNTWQVWAEHIKLLLDTGLRDERAMARFPRRPSTYPEALAKSLVEDAKFWLPGHCRWCDDVRPLTDEEHAIAVHVIATKLLSSVDFGDFSSFVCEKENTK